MKSKSRFYKRAVRNMLRAVLQSAAWATALMSALPVVAQPIVAQKSALAPEFRLQGDRVTLPFVMVREFPFVEGSIEGVQGKLMLDTGLEQALAINDHRVALTAVEAGGGQFGSGQKYLVRQAPIVKDLHLPGLVWPQVSAVNTQDATQLERITPDFIGWIGFHFWEGYTLKLDYRHLQATFYRGMPDDYLSDEKLIATLPFETGKLPHIPVSDVKIGDMEGTALFDTGAYGMLCIDAQSKARLIDSGVLKPTADDDKYDLYRLKIGDSTLPDLKGITVLTGTFPAAEQTGLHDKIILIMGYAFLSNYKTIWDYQKKTIYLLQK